MNNTKFEVGDTITLETTGVVHKITPDYIDLIVPGGKKVCKNREATTVTKVVKPPYEPKVGDIVTWGSGSSGHKVVLVTDTQLVYESYIDSQLTVNLREYMIDLRPAAHIGRL